MHESICTERKFVFGNENVFLDEIKRHYFYLKCICLFIAKVFFSARKLINYHEKCGQEKRPSLSWITVAILRLFLSYSKEEFCI